MQDDETRVELFVREKSDPRWGEFRVQRVSNHQSLVGVMGLNYHLRHTLEGVTPDDSKRDRTQGVPTS